MIKMIDAICANLTQKDLTRSTRRSTERTEEDINFSIFLFVLFGNSEENEKIANNNPVFSVNSVPPCEELGIKLAQMAIDAYFP